MRLTKIPFSCHTKLKISGMGNAVGEMVKEFSVKFRDPNKRKSKGLYF